MVYRGIFICCNSLLISYQFLNTNLIITPIILCVVLLIQFIDLGLKSKRTEDKTLFFLSSLIDNEEVSIDSKKNSYHHKLKEVLGSIISQSRNSDIRAEKNSELLDIILHHIKIGIILYYDDGEVFLMNYAARNLLSINYLNTINSEILDKINGSSSIQSDSCEFILNHRKITILSFQNIKKALDNKEMDSWNELIRTLNHEIMNSITPISSLANSALMLVDDSSNKDLVEALKVIESRSSNLLKFVDNYRSISQNPVPKRELISIKELLDKIFALMISYLNANGVSLKIYSEDEGLQIFVDRILFENVMINLVKNGVEAESKNIEVYYSFKMDKSIITVKDDGNGFSKESKVRAFLPFYTTKPLGSGIGLTIVRKIMFVHNGVVNIENVDIGSEIQLIFP